MGGRGKSNTAVTTYGSTVKNVTLREDPNELLAYAMVFEIHQPNMSKLGERRLVREISRDRERYQ